MTKPHPHKEILIAIANGLDTSELEVKNKECKHWRNGAHYSSWLHPANANEWDVRIKPKTMMFNGIELPMPLTEEPKKDQTVYLVSPQYNCKFLSFKWFGTQQDFWALKQGFLHSTKENAIAWANAMTPFTQTN